MIGRFFTKTVATAVAILAAAYILKGIHVNGTATPYWWRSYWAC